MVQNAREFNFRASKGPEFVANAGRDLAGIRAKTIRVHDSGDFYNQDYLNKWIAIAKQFPDKKFYAYTKSFHLNYSEMPSNFKVIQSYGGLLDSKLDKSRSHSRIFSTHSARKKAGYVDGNITDSHAVNGTIKIGLVYHGTRNLTEAQSNYFAV